jgi:hypothetical protein
MTVTGQGGHGSREFSITSSWTRSAMAITASAVVLALRGPNW